MINGNNGRLKKNTNVGSQKTDKRIVNTTPTHGTPKQDLLSKRGRWSIPKQLDKTPPHGMLSIRLGLKRKQLGIPAPPEVDKPLTSTLNERLKPPAEWKRKKNKQNESKIE